MNQMLKATNRSLSILARGVLLIHGHRRAHPIRPRLRPAPVINPWVVALTVTLATFMELLDTSIANVSLPYIAGGLGRSYDEVTWILTTYLVANAVVLPMSAWLSRVFGRKNYYMACVALFTITSFLLRHRAQPRHHAHRARAAGHRRRRPRAGRAGHPRRHLSAAQARLGLRALHRRHRHRAGHRPRARRLDHRQLQLALGLPHQHPHRHPLACSSPRASSTIRRPSPRSARPSATKTASLRIDGIGIALIGLGSAALEVLLDRGQIDDWFGSTLHHLDVRHRRRLPGHCRLLGAAPHRPGHRLPHAQGRATSPSPTSSTSSSASASSRPPP